ncbi:hypothetical protein MJI69_27870, partial [Salmonella enterica subsp. enterica serovar Anatum]|nr:hypothetical protein [Salmonella enterica subsp. enterica serovar Anatum]
NRYENIGRKNSFISYGPHWADVSNAPYGRYHKTTSGQGGINTSGAGKLVADYVIGMLGQNSSPFMLLIAVFALSVVMTNFMSNTA